MRENISPILRRTQAPNPTVEELDRLRAGVNLHGKITDDGVRQYRHQILPYIGLFEHKPFCLCPRPRRRAFNEIACERKGRSGKTNERNTQLSPQNLDCVCEILDL